MEHLTSHLTEFLILLFVAITFLQSGLDKVIDWQGNLGWLREHFKNTFLSQQVPILLGLITLLEVGTGILSILSIFLLGSGTDSQLPILALFLAGVTLLALFFGQRIAKDYAGAFTLTGYFLIVLFGVYLFSSQ